MTINYKKEYFCSLAANENTQSQQIAGILKIINKTGKNISNSLEMIGGLIGVSGLSHEPLGKYTKLRSNLKEPLTEYFEHLTKYLEQKKETHNKAHDEYMAKAGIKISKTNSSQQ